MNDWARLEVGKRYRLDVWSNDRWIEPKFVGEYWAVVREDRGTEICQRAEDNWIEVKPPITVLEGGRVAVFDNGSQSFTVEDMDKFPPGEWQRLYVPVDRLPEVFERLEVTP